MAKLWLQRAERLVPRGRQAGRRSATFRRMRSFLAAMLLSAAAFAQQDFSRVQIKAAHVAGNVWMLKGNGGNIAVSAGDDGVAMIDAEFEPLAPKIHAAIAQISPKPIKFLINTHWHFDHVGGNIAFADTATIMAQANARARMTKGDTNAFGIKQDPSPPKALPVVTFDQGLSLWWNGEEVKAIHPGPGHTDGDAVIWFTKSNVVHMGDDFVTYGFPFIDLNSGGSVKGMIAAVQDVLNHVPADAKIIPGHGPLSTVADLRPFLAMLRETSAIVQQGISAGKSLDQLKKENVLGAYSQKWSPQGAFINTDRFLETLYNDLSGKKSGAFLRHN